MKIPLSLLKSYVPLNTPVETICNTLTLLGIEVDSVTNLHPPFSKVIVGQVRSVSPHPTSEKLQIAQVHNGKDLFQVVCGAANCREGIKTAFAPVGSMLLNSDGSFKTLEKATIRGVESFGMLCSASELNLWKDSEGILELPLDLESGVDLSSILWDPILELSFTPNLGHAMSAKGIARELAAALKLPFLTKNFEIKENPQSEIKNKIAVVVENPEQTPIYMGRLIENVEVKPSPFWLQKALLSSGQKPINNVVDVTNYILLKTGHPLHAFDYDKIAQKKLTVQMSKQEHPWLGLDGIERTIPQNSLIISDAEKTVCIAGVLGSDNSATTTSTKNIFLEAASFDAITVRKTAKITGIRTQSAIRFEKGVDPNSVELALDEAAQIIAEITNGQIAQGRLKICSQNFHPKKISLRVARANAILGTKISQTEIVEILNSLEFSTQTLENGVIEVFVPTYRFDIHQEIDLIEEVVRLYGYNNLEKKITKTVISPISHDENYLFEKKIRTSCVRLGLQEVLTSDLISPKMLDQCLEFITAKGIKPLKTLHAKTEEYSILRPSMLPGLLQVAKTNVDLKNHTFHAFEIGRIHFLQNQTCLEVPMLGVLLSGKDRPSLFGQKSQEVDFYTLKGILENLSLALGIERLEFKTASHISFHPGRQAELMIDNHQIGSFGEIHPELLQSVDIKQRVLYAEINLLELMKHAKKTFVFKAIPNLPSSERDWTYTIDSKVNISEIYSQIEALRPKILEKFELIDLYAKEGSDTKNVTFRFTYRDLYKTVSAEEVDQEHLRLIDKIINHKK